MQTLLKNSKTLCIIGLSPISSKPSFQVASYLQSKGYKIIPVYPRGGVILGERAYQNIAEIKESVDIFVIFRSSEKCYTITQEILSFHSPKAIWLQLGIVNEEAKNLARSAGVEFVQNRCIKIEREQYE